MILFDPELDLEPDPAQGKRASARANSPETDKNARVPSARTLSRFLAEAQKAVRLRGQVNVLLTSDAGIRRLNRQFRGKNKATDVLSFPAMQVPGAVLLAGDLAVSIETALKQSRQQGHPLATELKVLILHGLLHLAGYDHETDDGQMARRERVLRGKLGLPQGLIERAGLQRAGRASSSPTHATEKRRMDGAPGLSGGTAKSEKAKAGRKKANAGPSTARVAKNATRSAQDDKLKRRARS
jgi:probable rRNA maturation factor